MGCCGPHPCARIGTFNIEWFGTSDPRKHLPRSREVVDRIARHLAVDLHLQLFVLEEINTASEEYRWLDSAFSNLGYRLYAAPGVGREQSVVLGWNQGEVQLLAGISELPVRADFFLDETCKSEGLRRPLAGRFRVGAFDFWLVGVHLKSQHGGGCAARVRTAQAEELVRETTRLVTETGERDVLIVGDFNAELMDPSLEPLTRWGGFRPLTEPNDLAKGSGAISYLKEPYQSVIDHVLILPGETGEWIDRSTRIGIVEAGPQESDYFRDISDHAPVWTLFRTDLDDD